MLERELRLLIEEDAIRDVFVFRQPERGYVIQINGRTLKSARRQERQFAKLDTVADLLHKFGIDRFTVVFSGGAEAVQEASTAVMPASSASGG